MDIDGLYRAGQFTAEAGPAILGIFDDGLFLGIHDDDIPRADYLADCATDTCFFINTADHL